MRDKPKFSKDKRKSGPKRPFRDGNSKPGDKPKGDRPWAKKKDWQKSGDDKPRGEGRSFERKRDDRPKSDRPYRSRDDKPRDDRPRSDRIFRSRDDRPPRDDRPRRDDRSRDDRPKFKDGFKKDGFKKRDGFKKDFKPRGDRVFGNRDRDDREPRGLRPNLYGFHAVREAWLNSSRDVTTFFATDVALENFDGVIEQGRSKGLDRPSVTIVAKDELDRMLPRGAVHQGLALIVEKLEEVFIQDFIIKSQQQDKTILLVLDQVTDPHNVGAILRSASAFGADGVIMQRKHAPELEGVLAKTASGAVEHIAVAYETNLSRTLEELKENGFFVFGLDEKGKREVSAILRNNASSTHKIVMVLGAEGDGMRRLIRENCDELVRLPTKGAIQSLNVSNAAAVALYALCS